jgi:protein-L-isoaspartate(D-aspartate) O-methyltransferase
LQIFNLVSTISDRESAISNQQSAISNQQLAIGNRQFEYSIPRDRMVARLREHYGIRDPKVLEAMRSVPRHFFVPEALQSRSYGDHALPISANQTISQPFIVARMTELLELDSNSRVLEIGAGSGYQTAVLAYIAAQVYAIERIGDLAREAQARIRQLETTTPRSSVSMVRSVGPQTRRTMRYSSPLVVQLCPNR